MAVIHIEPAWRQACYGAVIDLRTDPVVTDRDAFPVGDLQHPGRKILRAIVDGVIAAILPGKRGLRRTTDRADDRGAEMFGPLGEQRAHAASRGMDQDGLAGFGLINLTNQIVGCHAPHGGGHGGLRVDIVGEVVQLVGWNQPGFGMCPEIETIGRAVARCEIGHVVADRFDHSCPLKAKCRGEFGFEEINPFANKRFGEMDSRGLVAQTHLTGAGFADRDVFDPEFVGATKLVNAYCPGHDVPPNGCMRVVYGTHTVIVRDP